MCSSTVQSSANRRCAWCSCPPGSARAYCGPGPRGARRSPRSVRWREISRDQLGDSGVAVVARDVERGAAAPGPLAQVDAPAGDEQLRRQLIVSLDGVEELAMVVIAQAHRGEVLARKERAIVGDARRRSRNGAL